MIDNNEEKFIVLMKNLDLFIYDIFIFTSQYLKKYS